MIMPRFSQHSLENLSTCHVDLQVLFNEVIKTFDCVVTEGYRNEVDQEAAFNSGHSKLHYPHGKHNSQPSNAVDVYPYEPKVTVDWNDTIRFYYFGGYVMGIASRLKYEGRITHDIRYGGDWDGDTMVKDNSFSDTGHFELII
jgi:peptidoglycan L-alanyl-D-glutamate endopeptidase CwlK